jgi:hypothetical protein
MMTELETLPQGGLLSDVEIVGGLKLNTQHCIERCLFRYSGYDIFVLLDNIFAFNVHLHL